MLDPNEQNNLGIFQNFTIKIHVFTFSGQFYLTNESTWQKKYLVGVMFLSKYEF